jgi:hypothetical protein
MNGPLMTKQMRGGVLINFSLGKLSTSKRLQMHGQDPVCMYLPTAEHKNSIDSLSYRVEEQKCFKLLMYVLITSVYNHKELATAR